MKRKLWFTALLVLSIMAISAPSMAVEHTVPAPASSEAPAVQPDKARPLGERRPELPPSGDRIELALDAVGQAPAAATVPQQVQADVNLVLDDGGPEDGIGIGGNQEFIFLNRFTPDAGDFAFDLEEIRVYFQSGTTQLGDDIILVAYENTSGNADPATGANWLASFPATVQALDAWNVYTLSSPVHFDGPGDVRLAVIAL